MYKNKNRPCRQFRRSDSVKSRTLLWYGRNKDCVLEGRNRPKMMKSVMKSFITRL